MSVNHSVVKSPSDQKMFTEPLLTTLDQKDSLPKKKKLSREHIKQAKEQVDYMKATFNYDPNMVSELAVLGKILDEIEWRKIRTRSNSKTGLGMRRIITQECLEFILLLDPAKNDYISSRSRMTKLISEYVSENKLQCQNEKLFFLVDKNLSKLFNIKKYLDSNRDKFEKKIEKLLELRCILKRIHMPKEHCIDEYKKRFTDFVSTQSNVDSEDDILNIVSIKENDLISYREVQKILWVCFENEAFLKNGRHQKND